LRAVVLQARDEHARRARADVQHVSARACGVAFESASRLRSSPSIPFIAGIRCVISSRNRIAS
jgi:hypothetical protein